MKNYISDLIATTGLGLLAYGLWKISPPLALIVIGVVLIAFGLFLARREAQAAGSNSEINRAR